MSGLSSPGKQKFTDSELKRFINGCHTCFGNGWIYVAATWDRKKQEWGVYKFPCNCLFPGKGLNMDELKHPHRYRRPPDFSAKEIEKYVYIHPKFSEMMMARIKGKLLEKAKQFDNEINPEDLPF